MDCALKLVDDSPIFDADYLRQIDSVWVRDAVPSRFWKVAEHRHDYLLWLAGRLGFACMADFYRLELTTVYQTKMGCGLRNTGADRHSQRFKIASPTTIGSRGSSQRSLEGFGLGRESTKLPELAGQGIGVPHIGSVVCDKD